MTIFESCKRRKIACEERVNEGFNLFEERNCHLKEVRAGGGRLDAVLHAPCQRDVGLLGDFLCTEEGMVSERACKMNQTDFSNGRPSGEQGDNGKQTTPEREAQAVPESEKPKMAVEDKDFSGRDLLGPELRSEKSEPRRVRMSSGASPSAVASFAHIQQAEEPSRGAVQGAQLSCKSATLRTTLPPSGSAVLATTVGAFLENISERDIDTLARTIYGEARGEWDDFGLAALMAVGNVVVNRLRQRTWFGQSIEEVCRKPFQFSCWNEGDPNRKILLGPTPHEPVFDLCRRTAEGLLLANWPDLTKGANHYVAESAPPPSWAEHALPLIQIGHHVFYKL